MVLITGGTHTAALRDVVPQTRLPRLNKPFGLSELRRVVQSVAERTEA